MVASVLVVCVGNICRSVAGERILRSALPGVAVSSAGLAAVVGEAADPVTVAVAAERGIDLNGHVARQMTADIGAAHELILAMTPRHRSEIMALYPQLSGRTLMFDHWVGGGGVADPHGRPREAHVQTLTAIQAAAEGWVSRLR